MMNTYVDIRIHMCYNLTIKGVKNMEENENLYIGTKEAPKLWVVSPGTISRWCREKLIYAEQDAPGSPWRIPKNTIPPNIKRRKTKLLKLNDLKI